MTASTTPGQVVLNWTTTSGATYNIYRQVSGGTCAVSTTGLLFTTGSGTSSYADSTAVSGTSYCYTVEPSCNTNRASFTSICTALGSAAGVTANTSTPNQVTITWTVVAGVTYDVVRVSGNVACPLPSPTTLTTGNTSGTYTDGTGGTVPGGTVYSYAVIAKKGCATAAQSCVSNVTVTGGPGLSSNGKFSSGRPQNTTGTGSGSVRWGYQTSASTMSFPGVGSVYVTSNDRVVHSMMGTAGASDSGTWPGNVLNTTPKWKPYILNAPSQNRPVIPSLTFAGHTKEIYIGGQDGNVYCIDGLDGSLIWKTAAPLGDIVQGSPIAMLQKYGNSFNAVFVGVRNNNGSGAIYALDPFTGATLGTPFTGDLAFGGNLGVVLGYGIAEKATNTIYFASRRNLNGGGSANTVWALSLKDTSGFVPTGGVAATFGSFATKWAKAAKDIDGSPALRSGRLYIGNDVGEIYAYRASDGQAIWSQQFATNDGPVKYNVAYDWTSSATNQRLFFSTTNTVWCVTDPWDGVAAPLPVNTSALAATWSTTAVSSPSPINFNGSYLLVGSGDGNLYKFTSPATSSAITAMTLETGSVATVGGPSIDNGPGLAYVGNDAGKVFAIVP
ncbi:MAG TPA: PQQ-binding-like beta-propeller repeat protein [Thermoanaerobaculia bacterium]|nr:PQQ-binding-like beta-propeller repeat protein [Thermoanaerobaculia bacterium]